MSRELPEWIGKNDDEAIPARVRVRVFERFGGRCALCTRTVAGSVAPAYDHAVAIINGGGNRESNIQLLCKHCHQKKTRADVAEKSRTYRKRAAHVGVKFAPTDRRSLARYDPTHWMPLPAPPDGQVIANPANLHGRLPESSEPSLLGRETVREALEQIAVVCTDNMDRSCDHRMALDFVRQIANDSLSPLKE